MKLTVNQFNTKRHYYAVWFPLCNTKRYKSCKWYHVDYIFLDSGQKDSFIISRLSDIVLSYYSDIYLSLITDVKRKVEYNGCLDFLLSCSPAMIDRFASSVLRLYDNLYPTKLEILDEIADIIWPYKSNK